MGREASREASGDAAGDASDRRPESAAASAVSHRSARDAWRFRFRPLRLRDALAASRWRYPGEYAMYDLDRTLLLTVALLRRPIRLLAGVTFYAVALEGDPLIGVFSLAQRGADVEIGVGLRPDLNGRGLGLRYLLAGLELARQRNHPATFSLYVASFNRRAITVYERAGFSHYGASRALIYGGKRYDELRMTRPA